MKWIYLSLNCVCKKPHYWTFWERDLPGLRNLEGLDARKINMSSSVVKNR